MFLFRVFRNSFSRLMLTYVNLSRMQLSLPPSYRLTVRNGSTVSLHSILNLRLYRYFLSLDVIFVYERTSPQLKHELVQCPLTFHRFYYDKDWAARTSYRIARVRERTKILHFCYLNTHSYRFMIIQIYSFIIKWARSQVSIFLRLYRYFLSLDVIFVYERTSPYYMNK